MNRPLAQWEYERLKAFYAHYYGPANLATMGISDLSDAELRTMRRFERRATPRQTAYLTRRYKQPYEQS